MPAAYVAENALPLGALLTRSFAIGMRIVVMPRGGVAKPGETRQSLALGEHVAGNAGLPGGQRISQKVALNFRNARPVFHVEVFVGLRDLAVLGRERSDRALEIADRRQVFVQA